ncbi:alpha/beta fold hydrolase [candidate division KSB1 bacterium]|nr:alpha/beta fold hydrolase [candidate division KSB1 bacterium]
MRRSEYRTKNSYHPPLLLRNGHLQSIYPSLFRKLDAGFYRRQRIETPDEDFLDLDWSRRGNERLAIISHGLEGNSHRAYVVGMAKALNTNGWDVLAWNYRSCSGEPNRLLRSYHNGVTDDLHLVIEHALNSYSYPMIALIGFSMGGNLTLLYLGQQAAAVRSALKAAAVFSVPCDLKSSSAELAKFKNRIYMKRFLNMLHQKIKAKMELMPDDINDDDFHHIKNFKDFDDRYTAPIHGFKNAEDYWRKCSSRQFIPSIKIPTLIISAQNDPFLGAECFPTEEAARNDNIRLEIPAHGGHVGFVEFNRQKLYWSEKRAVQFIEEFTMN